MMKSFGLGARITLLTLIGVALPMPAVAGEDQAPFLSLAEAERAALSNNPALAAVEQARLAAAAVPDQAGSLPDPLLSLKAMNLPADSLSLTQENMTQLQVGITQAVPFLGKLELRREAAARRAEAAASARDDYRLRLLRDVRMAWWRLAWLDRALSIVRRTKDLIRSHLREAESRYRTGKGLQQDVLLAQLELSRLLDRETELRAQRESAAARLNALMGREAHRPVRLPDEWPEVTAPVPETARIQRWAHAHHPRLAGIRKQVEGARAREKLAEKDYWPDFMLGAAYGFRSGNNPLNGRPRADLASIGIGITLPLYAGRKQARAVDQRRAEKAQMSFMLEDATNALDSEIAQAASDLDAARERLLLLEQGTLIQAKQTTASMLAGYRVGNVDFLNLIRAQLTELRVELDFWKQKAALGQARARLAYAAGVERLEDLEKEGTHDE